MSRKGDVAIGVIALVFIAGWIIGYIQTNKERPKEVRIANANTP